MAACGDRSTVTSEVLTTVCEEPKHYIHKLTKHRNQADECNEFMDWAYSHAHLKVIEQQVPAGIFPDGVTARLADVKVQSRGPDDIIYDKHQELREKVARGNSFLKLDSEPWQCVIYALKKFTGGMGDDDDRTDGGDNSVWKQYFTKNFSEASSVIATRKANGEAAHLSCIKINGTHYIITGSKNVHMVIQRKSDIQKYTEPRYGYAREIAESLLQFLESISKKRVIRLLNFLDETRLTVVLEILNPSHQHVEDLSYLDGKCVLKFITWTSNDITAEHELCVLPPDIAIKVASHLGFDPVEYKEITVLEAESHMLQVRKQYGFEGEVFYYLDSSRNVIGLLKKKTAWYIICRAIREKVRNSLRSKKTFDPGQVKTKICRRIKEIQKWLNLCDESTKAWQDLGSLYLDWVVEQKRFGKITPNDVADLFPVTWTRFLKEKEVSDVVTYSDSVTS